MNRVIDNLLYRIPSLYTGDLTQEEEVLLWLIQQRTSDTIEQVTDKVNSLLLRDCFINGFRRNYLINNYGHKDI